MCFICIQDVFVQVLARVDGSVDCPSARTPRPRNSPHQIPASCPEPLPRPGGTYPPKQSGNVRQHGVHAVRRVQDRGQDLEQCPHSLPVRIYFRKRVPSLNSHRLWRVVRTTRLRQGEQDFLHPGSRRQRQRREGYELVKSDERRQVGDDDPLHFDLPQDSGYFLEEKIQTQAPHRRARWEAVHGLRHLPGSKVIERESCHELGALQLGRGAKLVQATV
mmetsp:Transcript_24562/g.52903  ORF Transcript_24562/g.52903 Transcript_24562/m.52903 type:complete len:219 (-) Transcript_24562:623-1279(-)